MLYLTKPEIISINKLLYTKYGGTYNPPFNFMNEASLDYLVDIVRNDDYHATLFEKAAVYMYNISSRHVFADGNKRTGTFVAIAFLEYNSFRLASHITDNELTELALNIAKGALKEADVIIWLTQNCEEILPEADAL